MVTSETESIQLVNLEPFTQYTITVTCVNDAGAGNTSSPERIRTVSARKFFCMLDGTCECLFKFDCGFVPSSTDYLC